MPALPSDHLDSQIRKLISTRSLSDIKLSKILSCLAILFYVSSYLLQVYFERPNNGGGKRLHQKIDCDSFIALSIKVVENKVYQQNRPSVLYFNYTGTFSV